MWMTNLKVLAVGVIVIGFYTGVAQIIPQLQSEVPETLDLSAGVTPEQLVAAGEGLFMGAGGCTACHGLGTRAPNLLTDHNGEGTIVYPGRAVGYDGIAPSLRLKALRDSIEDYQYLSMLESSGLAGKAEEVVVPLAGSWFAWETNPVAYERARARLAAMIAKARQGR